MSASLSCGGDISSTEMAGVLMSLLSYRAEALVE
jgi:hypothetical protein